MILRCETPAKINRELRVGARRADGYHEILSRFSSIDLADRLEVERADVFSFRAEGEASPADGSNLVVRAARVLAEKLGIPPRGRVTLTKRIPVGAGLGGGSSNAAAALRLFAELWEKPLPADELAQLAAAIGSDVPYFLVGGEADVSGRGEQVQSREDISSSDLWLLIPPFPLSTAEVYASFDRLARNSQSLPSLLEIERSGRFFGPNELAGAVLATSPRMNAYVDAAQKVAREVAVTGSGSALVLWGVSGDIHPTTRQLPEARLIACRTLDRKEYQRRTTPTGGIHGDHSGKGVSRQ